MLLSFGKYRGSLLEEIVLTEPGYVYWMINEKKPDLKLQVWMAEVGRLAGIIDQKPFINPCARCQKPATRLSITQGGYEINCWCEECKPYSLSCYGEKVEVVQNYLSALLLVKRISPDYFRELTPMLALAYAKGLREGFEEWELDEFFHGKSRSLLRNSENWNRTRGVGLFHRQGKIFGG